MPRRILRWPRLGRSATFALAALLLAGPGWFLTVRLLSPWTALRVASQDVPATARSGPPGVLTVATFNIAHGRGGVFGASNWQRRSRAGLRRHLDAIGDHIRRVDADLVVLNEVDFRSVWSLNVDQAKHLAERTGYRYRVEQRNFDAAAFGLGVRFGNVLLSRFPIDDAERLAFEPLSTRQRWLAGNHDGLLALVRTPEGPVAIAGLHLEVRSEEIRWRAAQALAHIRRDRTLPLLILGDLNSTPPGFPQSHPNGGRNAVASLFKAGFRADPAIRPHPKFFTFPSEAPRSVIDWIIAGPSFAISSTKTHPSALSDHLLVSATVTWAAEPGPKGANLSTRQLPRLLKSPG